MFKNLVVKDAFWQIIGRVASAIWGLIVIKIITPYLGPLRFWDYSTILKYFAIWSAFADFWLYVIALKQLGALKNRASDQLQSTYSKFVTTRFFMITLVYTLALVVAYLIPAYTSNPYLVWGLPLGMLFSASFMSAGIVQIPIQIFWKMEQLSIGLILARIFQITLLVCVVYVFYTGIDFNGDIPQTLAFNLIIWSVVLSGAVQMIYVWRQSNKLLKFQRIRDWDFSKNIIGANRKYGLAYYLSSFHTLAVLILLSVFYPTIEWFKYAGTWALALSLVEILLVVPSALGNSLIHKIADDSREDKMKSFGNLLTFIVRVSGIIVLNFTLFAPHIISFIWGEEFVHTATQRGSDTLLPFLALILSLSFIKQIFNYVFVSTDLQNKLLNINLFGVVIWALIGVPLILKYQLLWWLIAQATFEILFVIGAIYVAYKHKVVPDIARNKIGLILVGTVALLLIGSMVQIEYTHLLLWISFAIGLTGLATLISRNFLRHIMRGL